MRFVVEVQTDITFFQGVQLLETLLGDPDEGLKLQKQALVVVS